MSIASGVGAELKSSAAPHFGQPVIVASHGSLILKRLATASERRMTIAMTSAMRTVRANFSASIARRPRTASAQAIEYPTTADNR